MSKQLPIQINIPTPCHEDWEKMTPCGEGRFCSGCRKTVIDFTTWSDGAMYDFFSKNTTPICGRFLSSQLQRNIYMKPQPVSRLYRLAIACGLALMFTQMPQAHANVKAPIELAEPQHDEGDHTGSIEGTIYDKHKEPIVGAEITILENGIALGSAVSDVDGHFTVNDLGKGVYEVKVEYPGFKKYTIEGIAVKAHGISKVEVSFKENYLKEVNITYVPPLRSTACGMKTTFDTEDNTTIRMGGPDRLIATDGMSKAEQRKNVRKHRKAHEHKDMPSESKPAIDITEERATRTIFKNER